MQTIKISEIQAAHRYLQQRWEHQQPNPAIGDHWEDFFKSCDPMIRRLLAHNGLKRDDVDDCAQDVWRNLIAALRNFEYDPKRARFYTWLYEVVHRTVANFRRRAYRHGHFHFAHCDLDGLPSPVSERDAANVDLDNHEIVANILCVAKKHLSPLSYTILQMRWIQGLTPQQISLTVGLQVRQVWFREFRAIQKLRKIYKEFVVSDQKTARNDTRIISQAAVAKAGEQPVNFKKQRDRPVLANPRTEEEAVESLLCLQGS